MMLSCSAFCLMMLNCSEFCLMMLSCSAFWVLYDNFFFCFMGCKLQKTPQNEVILTLWWYGCILYCVKKLKCYIIPIWIISFYLKCEEFSNCNIYGLHDCQVWWKVSWKNNCILSISGVNNLWSPNFFSLVYFCIILFPTLVKKSHLSKQG